MKALTLIEPWASLVAHGLKKIETRSWSTPYRGPVAIHAGRNRDAIRTGRYVGQLFEEAGIPVPAWWMAADQYPLGCIVAVARLDSCFRMEANSIAEQTRQERAFGGWCVGRYAFVLKDVRRVAEPVPVRGALGLWDLPQDVAAKALARCA